MERVVAPSPDPGADARTRGQGRAAQTKDEEGATQMVRATTVPWASAPGLRVGKKRKPGMDGAALCKCYSNGLYFSTRCLAVCAYGPIF